MLHIERLRLQLPPGFEHRAHNIARLVGDHLAGHRHTGSMRLDRLSIQGGDISPHATDRQIAAQLARRISTTLGAKTGGTQ